ncbi:MAG: biotin/lipoyl-binding protein, partial [Desulfobacteraceae bacterium]|nr:biotin/lipoyl-binding protein [Desulfobacteraceae bacterium]
NIFIVGALATAGGNKGLDFLKGDRPINCRKISKEKKLPRETKPSAELVTEPVSKSARANISQYKVTVDGSSYGVVVEDETGIIASISQSSPGQGTGAEKPVIEIKSQLPGNVYEILFSVGDQVTEGDTMVVLEAMKMETPVIAPESGIIESIKVVKGQTVKSGQLLITLTG